jgi:hypothetical protein
MRAHPRKEHQETKSGEKIEGLLCVLVYHFLNQLWVDERDNLGAIPAFRNI